MRNSIFILLFTFTPLLLPAQQAGEELLDWSASRKLTWADYKASPDPNSEAAATTASYLASSYSIRNDDINYR
ncbi:MAG TPA: hypothetical protein PLO99_09475, partial [Chitinophagaceae bacterium]|nr:hypothetical protein [Chitinophagaceae bacterium]